MLFRAALAATLLLIPLRAIAQDKRLVLEYSDEEENFAVDSAPAELEPTRTLNIVVGGDAPPENHASRWRFELNRREMTRDVEGGVLTYSARVGDTTSYEVTFVDSQGETRFPGPLRFERAAGTGRGEAGADSESVIARPKGLPPPDRLYDREKNYVNLLFRQDGLPDALPRDLDDNDVIHVYLDVEEEATGQFTIAFDGTIRGQDVQVLGSGQISDIARAEGIQAARADGKKIIYFGSYGPYSSPSVKITMTRQEGGNETLQRSHVLRVNDTYIASIRFGVGRSQIAFNEFDLVRTSDSEGTVIANTADDEGELRSFVIVVFYAWRFWQGSDPFWNGRDLEEEPGPIARLNPMVGVGLDDIGEEYLAGLSFEIARGLDVFGAGQFAKIDRLGGGFEEGDPFPQPEDQLPVRNEWEIDAIWGLSVDVRIAASVLSGLLGGKK